MNRPVRHGAVCGVDSRGFVVPLLIEDDGTLVIGMERDTTGGAIPNGPPIINTYTAAGLLHTSTVTDGENTWVRTMTYDAAGNRTVDSRWVRQ